MKLNPEPRSPEWYRDWRESVGVEPHEVPASELKHLLAAAEVLARLEAILQARDARPIDLWWNPYSDPPIALVRIDQSRSRGVSGPDLLTALTKALDEAGS